MFRIVVGFRRGQMTSLTTGSYRFEYDFNATANDGRINAQRTFVSNSQIESISYSYDSLNRLSNANGGNWTAGYGYDGFGNLQTVTPTGAGPSAMNVTVNPATNRLNGWTYDANGNVTAQSGFTGTCDVENRLLEASKNSTMLYGYGADNRRIWESKRAQVFSNGDTIEEYLTYWSGQRIGKYKVRWNGTINSGPPDSFVFARMEENVYFGSKPLRLGTETNITADRLGSIRRGTAKDYFPYGQENPSTTAGDKEKYGTYKHDAATDLSYADQRYYAPGTGRFMTADPIEPSESSDPGTWKFYSYVFADPINYNDPEGLDANFKLGTVVTPNCGTRVINEVLNPSGYRGAQGVTDFFNSTEAALGLSIFLEVRPNGAFTDPEFDPFYQAALGVGYVYFNRFAVNWGGSSGRPNGLKQAIMDASTPIWQRTSGGELYEPSAVPKVFRYTPIHLRRVSKRRGWKL